jgi:hypothetical protein
MFHGLKTSTLVLAILAVAVAAGGGEGKAAPAAGAFQRLATVNATTAPAVAMARTPDGTLHLVYQTFAGRSLSGLGSISIGASGTAGAAVQALAWQAGQPGLLRLSNGTLEAVFGAISPGLVSSVWGITSSDGGTTWSAPANVRGGGPNEALAYGSDVTAAMAGSTPVLTLPQAGNLVVQTGLGAGSPSYQVTNANDGSAGNPDLAVDAATGEAVASWTSIAHEPSLYLQRVAPSAGAPQLVPGQAHNALVIAGRDVGPGVFGAYSTDGTHVRLLRYGGGSVAVGSRRGTTAKALGVATGIDGRIWVMWGDDSSGGVAVTRSNKAVTRFEPIQHVDPKAGSLYRIQGDGRLGPLDLLVDAIPSGTGAVQPPGLYHARVRPVLSAVASLAKAKKTDVLTVRVTDAGDPVAGAGVSVKGKKAKTNAKGIATLTFPSSAAGTGTLVVTCPTYRPLAKPVGI